MNIIQLVGGAALNSRFKMEAAFNRLTIPIPIGSWAIGRDDMAILRREVLAYRQHKNVKILEFGSGVSTFIFLSLSRYFDSLSLTTIEGDCHWASSINHAYKSARRKFPKCQFNLIQSDHAPGCRSGFDTGNIGELEFSEYDIVFIDAPPDTTAEQVRLSLSLDIMKNISTTGRLIVHDTIRTDEDYLFHCIKGKFLHAEQFGTRKGISVFKFPIKSAK
jgi:predicted O-methyltransferase YrrM